MTTRAIFNRQYTEYTPGSQQVWLVNGAGVTTSFAKTADFTAGENLIQGQVVYVSGSYVLAASAASGVAAENYNAIGITAAAGPVSETVPVVLDDTVIISSYNITAESSLTPGQYYFLSKYTGEITRYTTTSGLITASGGYAALVYIGQALSSSELQVEIEPPVVLYD